MSSYHYFLQRPHLLATILLAILAFLLLTLAAAKLSSDEKPVQDLSPKVIATPSDPTTTTR